MIAPSNAPRMTFGVTMLTSIHPLPTVLRQRSPVKAATKLKKAAQRRPERDSGLACAEGGDGVRGVVEAVMKSNIERDGEIAMT